MRARMLAPDRVRERGARAEAEKFFSDWRIS
jgi:hypothetical protein